MASEMRCSLLFGSALAVFGVSGVAAAQTILPTSPPVVTQPSPSEGLPPTVAAADAAQDTTSAETSGDIVVTGSRIARRDYSSNTPVVTIGEQAIEKTGSVTIDTVLKQLPQFVGSTGSSTNSNGNQGQANVQLRGLGRQRTLVLLDGRRIIPSNSDGSVDTNILPSLLLENVEIITGGASAVYGSDAIGGVVNLKLRHHYDGLLLSGQSSVSSEGDGAAYKLGVAGGTSFAGGRGNTVFSAEYARRESVFLADRNYTLGANRDAVLPQGLVSLATGLPSQAAVNAVFARYGVAAGVVRPQNTFGFNADGSLFSNGLSVQNYRGSTDPSAFTVTPAQVFAEGRQYRYLQLPLETYTFFNRTEFEVASDTHLYVQGFYTRNESATQGNPLPASSSNTTGIPTVPVTNPFIPADLRTLLASRANPTAPVALNLRFDALGPRLVKGINKTGQVVAGVEGKLGFADWSYSAFGSYGENTIRVDRTNYVSRSALSRLLSAPDGGASICTGGFNPFGTQSISASCAALLAPVTNVTQKLKQYVAEVDLQGGLFHLPAGDVRVALGANYRKDSFAQRADAQTAGGDIIAGVGANFAGKTDVKEVYGELLVPLIHDTPLIKRLELDFAGRYSDYSSIGRVGTYKADLSWDVVSGITLRGGYERAIRAPSVGELFSPTTQTPVIIGLAGSVGSGDPCDVRGAYRTGPNGAQVRALCLAQGLPSGIIDTFTFNNQSAPAITGGNTGLKEEKADTYSAGVVLRPAFDMDILRNFSFSVDYYKINLQDAIGSITPQLVLSRCFNASGSSNADYSNSNLFCSLISRGNDGALSQIGAQSLNLAGYKTAGVDIQLDWRFRTESLGLPDGGELSLNVVANRLTEFKIQSLAGDQFLEYAGTIGNGQIDPVAISRPKWKSQTYVSYSNGPFLLGATWRYIGPMKNAANVGNVGTALGVASRSYFDLNARIAVSKKFEMFGSVVNISNVRPPVYPSVGLTDFATYDTLGRYISVGVRARF